MVWGRSRGLCVRSWVALRPSVGGLGPLLGPMLAVLGPMLAVLGRSWRLCWRSWAALGAYVGGLGSGSGPKLAVLGPKWSVLEAIRAKSGPNPSKKAVLGREWFHNNFWPAGAPYAFFSSIDCWFRLGFCKASHPQGST